MVVKKSTFGRRELTQEQEGHRHGEDGRGGSQRMGHSHRSGPLAVVSGVTRSARAQVAGPEVGATAAVQARIPQALVDVFARATRELASWATAKGKSTRGEDKDNKQQHKLYSVKEIHGNVLYSHGICIILRLEVTIKILHSGVMLLL